jgi:hypothetical protein
VRLELKGWSSIRDDVMTQGISFAAMTAYVIDDAFETEVLYNIVMSAACGIW